MITSDTILLQIYLSGVSAYASKNNSNRNHDQLKYKPMVILC